MITILMPVRNAAATLPTALGSVLRQSFDDWELLAVDDGSTDESAALLAACGDSRVRLIRRPAEGLVAALNAGLELARGALLARFDADDIMHRDRLRRQAAAGFDGVLGCGVRLFPRQAIAAGYRHYEAWLNGLVTHEQIVRDRFVESPLAHPSVMLPTHLPRSVGGYRAGDFPEDYDLWLRLAAAGARFAKLPEVLHFWRDHPGRLSRQGGPYRRAAFRACKLAHLLDGPLRGVDRVTVWGAGDGGREWSRLLTRAGLSIHRHVDIRADRIGGTVRGAPVIGPEALTAAEPLILVTVGVHGAREEIRGRLAALGLREGEGFWCVG